MFKVGQKVMIRLWKAIKLPGLRHRKVSIQRVGPIKILEVINPLAYRLEIPYNWKIHPVLSIEQLEPVPGTQDPYDRTDNVQPGPVVEATAEERDGKPAYEVER